MNVHRKERLCCNWNKIKYNWICHYQTVYSNYRCVSVINTILMRLKIEIEFENILLSVLIISNDHHCTLSHHEIILIALQFFFSTYQSLSRDLNIELNSLEIDTIAGIGHSKRTPLSWVASPRGAGTGRVLVTIQVCPITLTPRSCPGRTIADEPTDRKSMRREIWPLTGVSLVTLLLFLVIQMTIWRSLRPNTS